MMRVSDRKTNEEEMGGGRLERESDARIERVSRKAEAVGATTWGIAVAICSSDERNVHNDHKNDLTQELCQIDQALIM